MTITPFNIKQHELIGMEIEIAASKNQSLVGLKGIVTDETRNMLVIEQENNPMQASGKSKRFKRLIKSQITFKTKLQGKTVEVDGNVIAKRPEDRIKK